MTCIAGIVSGDGFIYMGGDSLTSGSPATIRKEPKVFVRKDQAGNEWIMGTSGSANLHDIVRFVMPLPVKKAPRGKKLHAFIVCEFVPLLKNTVAKAGLLQKKDGADKLDGSVLVGVNGKIFYVGNNFCITEERENFVAIGSGGESAAGSLFRASKDGFKDPEKEIRNALGAAERFASTVRGPFHVLKIKSPAR